MRKAYVVQLSEDASRYTMEAYLREIGYRSPAVTGQADL
jgi:hypothetical protein